MFFALWYYFGTKVSCAGIENLWLGMLAFHRQQFSIPIGRTPSIEMVHSGWNYVLCMRPCYFPLKIFIRRMPAEYSRNPKNISRDKWEREMSMKEIILRDAKMCAYAARNVEHFKYLMKRLGYVFKKDAWMEVQAPRFRYYHKLAKMDEMFSEETLRHHVDMPWMAKPYFYSSDIRGLHRAKLSSFQKKFYAKLYRLRIVEQKRFAVGGAKYIEDLKRFHQL